MDLPNKSKTHTHTHTRWQDMLLQAHIDQIMSLPKSSATARRRPQCTWWMGGDESVETLSILHGRNHSSTDMLTQNNG
jgi:hypothetical protein